MLGFTPDRIPTLRTIQNWARGMVLIDESGAWSVGELDDVACGAVLCAVAAVIER